MMPNGDEPKKEGVREVAPDPKKLSPLALVQRSINFIVELKGRELEELQGETPHIRAALGELNHLVGVIARIESAK